MKCGNCGSEFKLWRARTKFCSTKCRRAKAKADYRAINPAPALASATTGALHELMVAADLLRKGYSVFRALSPSCPGDLAVIFPDGMKLVEVTTGYRSATGRLNWPPHAEHTFDILAIVEHTGCISYFPAGAEGWQGT